MKMYRSPSRKCQGVAEQDDKGFTLIEILIAIVLVGILSAVAVVGISNLTKQGAGSACIATKDAATAASVVYFTSTGGYPADFTAMTTAIAPATPVLATGDTVKVGTDAKTLVNGSSWTLTMLTGGGAVPNTFKCTP